MNANIFLLLFKSLGYLIVYERSLLCLYWLHLFDEKYSKNSNIMKSNYNSYFLMYIMKYIPLMAE